MVKSKNLSLSDLMLSIFKFKTFQKSFSSKLLAIYNLVLLLIIAVISLFSNNIGNYAIFDNLGIFIFMLIGLPIVLGFFYGIFYILLNAYEIKKKKFIDSFLVFLTIFLPFILIGNFLNLIDNILLIPQITLFFAFLIFILTIWFFIVFVKTFMNYYKTDMFKILSSIIIIFALNSAVLTLQYLTYLISNLN